MTSSTASEIPFKLKKSSVVHALAIVFMLMPFVNLAITMGITFSRDLWFSGAAWSAYFTHINFQSWFMLALNFSAGFSLWFPRKWVWFLALTVLSLNVVFNIVALTTANQSPPYLIFVLMFLKTAMIAGLLFYFRYPYLDRRDHITGLAKRYRLSHPVSVIGINSEVVLEEISRTGARLHFKRQDLAPSKGAALEFLLPPLMQANVIHSSRGHCGVKFVKQGLRQRLAIWQFIRRLKA